MPSLLDLPVELRFQIIELVLCHSRAPPLDPATTSQNRVTLDDLDSTSWSYGPQHNMYEPDGVTTSSLSLLLTNHQLWAETQSALQRLPARFSYYLDAMLVNERELWPTWLSVPALRTRLDNVAVTVRICGTKDHPGRSEFVHGDGSPPQIVWCFYSLMERFLTYGPVGERKLGSQDRGITVNLMTLNIVSPPDSEPTMNEPVPSYADWYQSRLRDVDNKTSPTSIIRAEWLAKFLRSYLGHLLAMSYHTARYGMILYERIGIIRLCADGVLTHEYDLCTLLADIRHNDASTTFGDIWPRENRVPFFWAWKKKALRKRKEAGLPVIDAADLELMGS
ncbi:hypothetical protein MMC34_007485 [Xylographa carneopallida]|nr:hypothetical protein [Xylographa carneopallida]